MTSLAIRGPCLPRGVCGALTVACLVFCLASTRSARAEEPTIDEVRYHPTELPPDGTRARLLLTGTALTAGWYGIGVGTSFLWPNAKNARELRLPIVGPWLALGDIGCGSKERDCRDAVLVIRTLAAVLSGVGQAGGLFAIAEGLFLDTGTAPAAAPGSAAPGSAAPGAERPQVLQQSRGPSWAAVPVVLPDGAAIQVVGHF